ncbi:MAG: glycoside hydrolase family 172 protein [Candidatus Helarchaeota archaeon]
MVWFSTSLRDLPRLRPSGVRRRRVSSHDPTHGNKDFLQIRKGTRKIIADLQGAGCVTHIWMTMDSYDRHYLRKVVLRAYWDEEENPSIEVPIGDFFGIGHAICKNFVSLPLTMSPESGKGFNCFFPMPFATRAIFEVENQAKGRLMFYYYIDYEEYEELPLQLGRFHACWHRSNPCQGISEEGLNNVQFQLGGKNEDFAQNYIILEAEGKGHYVGCNLNIHNLRETEEHNWPGEGDDMIFIDGDPQPTIFGTGTEDYFNTAYCPTQEYHAPYHGVTLPGGKNWSGKISYYRFHIQDPIYFEKSIKVTIEHGHANHRSDDYSSTAYWYQTEPHKKFPPLPPVNERLPRSRPKAIK